VTYVQSATVRVTSREEVPVEIDGELWGRTASLEFRQTAKTLRVFVPRVPRVRWRDKLFKKLIPWLD
jgi:diacylglycerol kinase family enzyme